MRFVLVCFLFLGLAFYELSGGTDFEPRRPAPVADASGTDNVRLAAGSDVVVPDPVKVAAIIDAPEVARIEPVPVAKEVIEPASELQTSLAFRFNQPPVDGAEANLQLASLADGTGAFPQPTFLDPTLTPASSTPTEVEPEPAALDIREVTGSRVNMRQGPGTTYAVIGTLYYDDQIEVLEDLGNGWVQLRKVGDDRIGWMASRFVGAAVN